MFGPVPHDQWSDPLIVTTVTVPDRSRPIQTLAGTHGRFDEARPSPTATTGGMELVGSSGEDRSRGAQRLRTRSPQDRKTSIFSPMFTTVWK